MQYTVMMIVSVLWW